MRARYYGECHEEGCETTVIKPGENISRQRPGLRYAHTKCLNRNLIKDMYTSLDQGLGQVYMCVTCGKTEVAEIMQSCEACICQRV